MKCPNVTEFRVQDASPEVLGGFGRFWVVGSGCPVAKWGPAILGTAVQEFAGASRPNHVEMA